MIAGQNNGPQRGWSTTAFLLACGAVSGAWILPVLLRRGQPELSALSSVSALLGFFETAPTLVGAAVGTLLVGLCLLRLNPRGDDRLLRGAALFVVLLVAVSASAASAYFAILAITAAGLALSIACLVPPAAPRRLNDVHVTIGLYVVVGLTMCVFSMHRFWAFGAGSWDMGCNVHNLYRASRFLGTGSTVLGDVNFLGDHFIVGIYLLAPFFWISSSGYMLLFVQSFSLAATAPSIFLIARHRGVDRFGAGVLGLATGLSFGLQSAAYYDSHALALGFGFLAAGLWAFETGRLRWATVLFFTFALFKESLGAYVVGLGLLACARGLWGARDRRWVRYGAAWIVFGALWFVLVNRVFMPALIALGPNAPEPHETFVDFGSTVFEALIGVLSDPMRALAALFVPFEKVRSLAVTVGGTGWLALMAPQILLPALPLVAERFLSSKATMWQMGYHYAAPLCLYAGWAAALGWSALLAWLQRALAWAPLLAKRGAWLLALYVLISMLLINALGYRHPANFHRWRMGYFSTPERAEQHREAIAFLRGLDREARLAVQNRILPHLADRPWIYQLHHYERADWVLLSVGESAWPKDDGYAARLAARLRSSPDWGLAFEGGRTLVFRRLGVRSGG